MNNKTEQLETILNDALDLRKQGKSASDIFNLFPEHKKELSELFQTIEWASAESSKIVPNKEILESVTKNVIDRYTNKGEEIGRISFPTLLTNQIHAIMSLKKILPVGVLVVIAALFIFSKSGTINLQNTNQTAGENEGQIATQVPVAPATGNIDDTINALLAFSTNGQFVVGEDTSDLLITSESEELNEFGQSYNENEF